MATLTWRVFPVFTLTVKQFAGGKAVRVVAGLSFIPALFALIYLINPDVDDPLHFVGQSMYRSLILAPVLPITVLILATGALGNEVEDRTLPYLTLKPIGRFRIVIEKFLGVLVVAIPLMGAGAATTFFLAYRGEAADNLHVLWSILLSLTVAVVGYGAIFLFVSLLISRALLAGIIYSLLWETLLARYLPGLRYASVVHYADSVFVRMLDERIITYKQATSVNGSIITIAVTAVISIILATWRLRRMNLD